VSAGAWSQEPPEEGESLGPWNYRSRQIPLPEWQLIRQIKVFFSFLFSFHGVKYSTGHLWTFGSEKVNRVNIIIKFIKVKASTPAFFIIITMIYDYF
jgi:hypothetical protein